MPKNEGILDWKPKENTIIDWKPKGKSMIENRTDQLYSVTLGAGMWLGFNSLTYPTTITITSSKSP